MTSLQRSLLITLLLGLLLTLTVAVFAQEDTGSAPSVPPLPAELSTADAGAGMILFQNRCASCHGPSGLGDGELAAQSIQPPLPIGTSDYLVTADLVKMRETVLNGNIERGMPPFGPGTTDPLSDEDITNIFAALYDLPKLNAPLPEVTVRGSLVNGTTGEPVTGNLTIELAAFTQDFTQTVNVSTTLDAEGNFLFDLKNVSPTWAFITSVTYQDINFTGDVFQFAAQSPEQETTITVFDATTEATDIVVQQWHIVVDVSDNSLNIGEVFVFANQGNEVYVGETGDANGGTLRLPIPTSIESPTFRRGFGGAESFLPANEIFQNGDEWVDTLPLYPGAGGMIILAQYSLPYDNELTLERPTFYPVESVSIVVPEGITVDTADGWVGGDAQSLSGQGSFVTYEHAAANPDDTITIQLSGEPVLVIPGAEGAESVVRNESNELFIGVVALLIVGGGAFYIYRTRQASAITSADEPVWNKEELLQAIADLDDEYATGEMSEGEYRAERQRLKLLLLDLWEH
ncbi:MAG: cytochrome c [Candidatus Promineifilaceae bacterium]